MKSIAFFSDEITVVPHTATDATDLSRPISIREFSRGQRVSLYDEGNGDLLVRTVDGRFISGPEHVAPSIAKKAKQGIHASL